MRTARLLLPLLALLSGLAAAQQPAAPAPAPAPARQAQPHGRHAGRTIYRWKDAQGKEHITSAQPPGDAEVVQVARSSAQPGGPAQAMSSEAQRAWTELDRHLSELRSRKDTAAMEAVVESLVQDARWGGGFRLLPLAPALGFALVVLLGWWSALTWRPARGRAAVAAGVLLGFATAQLLLTQAVYAPQAARMRPLVELLGRHPGSPKPLPPDLKAELDARVRDMDAAAGPLSAPWRFPRALDALDRALHRAALEP